MIIWLCIGFAFQDSWNCARPRSRAHQGAPLVEGEIGVATEARPLGLDVLDPAEQLLDEVEAVDCHVVPRIGGAAKMRGQRATLVGRVFGAAEDVDADDVADRAGSNLLEQPDDLWVVQERVVDTGHQVPGRGHLADPAGVLNALGDRLLDQHVAVALQRLDRDLRVSARRGQHVDHVRPCVNQSVERSEGLGVPLRRGLLGTRGVQVADPYQLDIRERLHRGHVELADVAGSNQPGAKWCSCHDIASVSPLSL